MMFAVHISDGVLSIPWLIVGWVCAGLLMTISAWRFQDSLIPRVGVLTAVFFVGSQIHIPLGGVSVHLLLNGLIGVILGYRATIAIAVGLLLQVLLFGHGGFTSLGTNISVYAIPAVITGFLSQPIRSVTWISRPAGRWLIVFSASLLWFSTAILATQWAWRHFHSDDIAWKWEQIWLTNTWVLCAVFAFSIAIATVERRIERNPDFAIGMLLGAGTAYATVNLNFITLAFGADRSFQPVASIVLLSHLPVIVIESLGTGFVFAYFAHAKPEWVGARKCD